MVEVFKTNIQEIGEAKILSKLIEREFRHYEANFDLEDCDKILRVQNKKGLVDATNLIKLFMDFGYKVEVLPDLI